MDIPKIVNGILDVSDTLEKILDSAVQIDKEKVKKAFDTLIKELQCNDAVWVAETLITEILLSKFHVTITNIYAEIEERIAVEKVVFSVNGEKMEFPIKEVKDNEKDTI